MLKILSASVPDLEVQNVTVVDAGQTNNNSVPQIVSFVEQLKQTTGMDISQLVRRLGEGNQGLNKGQ